MEKELYAMILLLQEYSNDSKYSKRCFCNQMAQHLEILISELMNPKTRDLDKPYIDLTLN